MKKMFLLIAMAGLLNFADAQIRKIPSAVTDAFTAKYGNVKGVEWKDKLTSFQGGFTTDGVKTDAYFDSKGTWIESDRYIKYDAVPGAAKDGYKKSTYSPDWVVQQAAEIQKPDGTQYRLKVKKSDLQVKYIYFNTDGKLVKEAVKI